MYKLSYTIFLRVSLGFYFFDSRFKPYKSNTPFESRRANPRAGERAGKIIAKIKNTLFSPLAREQPNYCKNCRKISDRRFNVKKMRIAVEFHAFV